MRVLLVEDDPMIGQVVHDELKDSAHAVDWVRDGEQALSAVSCQYYDIVLLDLGLPGRDGMQVLTSIRKREEATPVVVITARDGVSDRVNGLDAGADDYLLKPFDMAELQARMRAVIRRKGGQATPVLSNGVVTLDPVTRQATSEQAEGVVLSNREFSLLQALLVRPGAILSRGELEDRIYGWGEEVESNAVEFLIHGLRKKLGAQVIKNVRGAGWFVSRQA